MLFRADGRSRINRRRDERYSANCVLEHDNFGGDSDLVWARIRRDGCTALLSRGSFHKAILATIDLSYLRLILRLPALIFTSVPRNNFKTIINPVHIEFFFSVSSNRITNVAILSL